MSFKLGAMVVQSVVSLLGYRLGGMELFFPLHDCSEWLCSLPCHLSSGCQCSFPWGEADHLHLVLRLRKHGAVPQLTHTSAWYGTCLSQGTCFTLLCHIFVI